VNLAIPALVLRAAREGRVRLDDRERDRVLEVLEIRRAQAEAVPPEDAPWSHFDAAQALVLVGDAAAAVGVVERARRHVHAPWEAETFSTALDDLERAGAPVAALRAALGVAAPRTTVVAPPPRPPGRTFRAALREASWYRENVPCAAACPVGTDAGAYVSLAAEGRFGEAFRAARGPNPFASVCGRICAAPCEDACRRGKLDAPVAIRALKRFLTERHGAGSADSLLPDVLDGSVAPCMEGEAYASHLRKLGGGGATPRRVAVVGGGPAGLACAHDLAFLGHRVTLYEASSRLGGMMRHGIPEYRLPRDVLDAEIGAVLDLGVEVRLGEGLDARRTLDSLFADGVEAVFLASGAGRGRPMEAEGVDLDGVVRAIDFLLNVNEGFRMDLGPRVVVVGGGNVAIDVARTARLGRPPDVLPRETREAARAIAPALRGEALRHAVEGRAREVHVVARQPMGEWPSQRSVHSREEVEEARREGVAFHPLRGVRRILGRDGRVCGVELAEVVRLKDERGRPAPAYGAHAAETIACDAVLLAVGQEPDLDYLEGTAGLGRTPSGLVEVDRATLATSRPGVYAGGDAAFGPRTLIEAVAEGKRAARSIHAQFSGGRRLVPSVRFTEVPPRSAERSPDVDRIPREDPACIAVERRTGIAEVEGAYDEAAARRQAARCLQCHVQTVYDGTLCVACGRCTDVCPHRCLSFAAPEDVDVEGEAAGALAAAGGAAGTAWMLKDETRCVRCGLCAERCPTGAMTMERFDLRVAEAVA
jgi:NADPH-dependent glutamate synthase beta subunit-like oxidoreductase